MDCEIVEKYEKINLVVIIETKLYITTENIRKFLDKESSER